MKRKTNNSEPLKGAAVDIDKLLRLEEKDISFHEGRLSILLELKRETIEEEIKKIPLPKELGEAPAYEPHKRHSSGRSSYGRGGGGGRNSGGRGRGGNRNQGRNSSNIGRDDRSGRSSGGQNKSRSNNNNSGRNPDKPR